MKSAIFYFALTAASIWAKDAKLIAYKSTFIDNNTTAPPKDAFFNRHIICNGIPVDDGLHDEPKVHIFWNEGRLQLILKDQTDMMPYRSSMFKVKDVVGRWPVDDTLTIHVTQTQKSVRKPTDFGAFPAARVELYLNWADKMGYLQLNNYRGITKLSIEKIIEGPVDPGRVYMQLMPGFQATDIPEVKDETSIESAEEREMKHRLKAWKKENDAGYTDPCDTHE